MYTIKVSLWKKNKYSEPDEIRYVGEYLTAEAANIDTKEIHDRIYYSAIYVRVVIEITEEDENE